MGGGRRGELQFGHDAEVVENVPACGGRRPRPRRFNSATTQRSWRTRPGTPARSRRRACFNSATTQRSWRTPARRRRHHPFRRSFNSATTQRSWRTTTYMRNLAKMLMLQFGHDAEVVENARPAPSTSSRRRALQFGHDAEVVENLDEPVGQGRGGGASIRPRRRGRGERTTPSSASSSSTCFNSATTQRSWRTRSCRWATVRILELQFGHDAEVVENDRPRSLIAQCRARLQFGHDAEVVENGAGHDYARPGLRASIRPRRRGRGEPWPSSYWPRTCTSFNSATTQRSWRTGLPRRDVKRNGDCFNSATTQRSWRT